MGMSLVSCFLRHSVYIAVTQTSIVVNVGTELAMGSWSSVLFVQHDSSGSVRVRLSNSLGSFGSIRRGLRLGFEFGVFGSDSVRLPSLVRACAISGTNYYHFALRETSSACSWNIAGGRS